jgi:hypothetical protein
MAFFCVSEWRGYACRIRPCRKPMGQPDGKKSLHHADYTTGMWPDAKSCLASWCGGLMSLSLGIC